MKYSIADDFEVSTSALATGVSFNMSDSDDDLANWDGVLRWWICSDSGGLPDTVLAEGIAVDVSWTMLQPTGSWDLYLGSFSFGQSLPLTTGTRYWLALHMNRTWSYNVGLVWNFTPTGHYSPAVSDLISFGDWSQSVSSEFAFSIIASTEVTYIFTDGFELADTSIWSTSQP